MSRIIKLFSRIILERIRERLRSQIPDEQFGFVAGKATNNTLFSLTVLSERALEVQKDVFVCFVNYEKAFGKGKHVELLKY